MDSLTQFALGASVGVAVMGRKVGVRKAALTGGILGTLPDLDVFWPNDDPVSSFVTHRSATHSLLVHALVTPLLGEGLRRLFSEIKDHRNIAYLGVFLCLTTHALLDAMTIYGTQLFWPVWKEPLGVGSIFIIDPIYTIPLFIVTVWALFLRQWSALYARGLIAALVFSSGYLLWSVGAQSIAYNWGKQELVRLGITPQQMLATPAPFSTLFWRIIATDETYDYSVYIPLLGGKEAMTTYRNTRIPAEIKCWVDKNRNESTPFKTLADFSDGFFRLDIDEGTLRYADLRMGLNQTYVFQFNLAKTNGRHLELLPATRAEVQREFPGDRIWLRNGILGKKEVRVLEKDNLVTAPAPLVSSRENEPVAC